MNRRKSLPTSKTLEIVHFGMFGHVLLDAMHVVCAEATLRTRKNTIHSFREVRIFG